MIRRPVTLLIAALGGEGGGVLTGWIVNAARMAGLPVQATSIPGVPQRTGATTYYVEVWPESLAALGGREPVLALGPAAGEVDVMLASELLEASRAIQSGLVTPDRTTLIASTHRVHTTREKMAMGDGRFDGAQLIAAARERAAVCRLADLAVIAEAVDAPLGSVMLGALAGSGKLSIDASHFRGAIRDGAKTVEANLRGFEAGLESEEDRAAKRIDKQRAALETWIANSFPAEVHDTLGHAVTRLTDYQDAGYAGKFLDRLTPLARWLVILRYGCRTKISFGSPRPRSGPPAWPVFSPRPGRGRVMWFASPSFSNPVSPKSATRCPRGWRGG
jgi:indolepyruvate ferredoxin oxidoreductase beta subunit